MAAFLIFLIVVGVVIPAFMLLALEWFDQENAGEDCHWPDGEDE